MFKAFVAGLVFWVLTLLFPTISIEGFWTIAGVVIIGAFVNIVYQMTLGLLIIPFRILLLGLIGLIINTGIIYLMSIIFINLTLIPARFGGPYCLRSSILSLPKFFIVKIKNV